MFEKILDFFSFADPNVRSVTLGTLLLGIGAAVAGCFTFLRKRSLSGDMVAHAVLPGICVGFLLSGEKNPVFLILGAALSGWLSLLVIDYISQVPKVKPDTAVAVVLSFFFGLGMLMLTVIQHSGMAGQTGLSHFLFGSAASLTQSDVWAFSGVSLLIVIVSWAFFKELNLLAFDARYMQTIGLPLRFFEWLQTTLTVLAIVVGIQAVGVVLTSALLITPAAAARFWTNQTHKMLFISAIFGAISGIIGAFVSYTAPQTPTGPWIVATISSIAIFSFFAAPKKGIIAKYLLQTTNKHKVIEENILKAFYHQGENNKEFYRVRSVEELLNKRYMPRKILKEGLTRLIKQGALEKAGPTWKLTNIGYERGKEIARRHRLWELYLAHRLQLPTDHLHDDAEVMEHLITPEIEQLLNKELDHPTQDPHGKIIP